MLLLLLLLAALLLLLLLLLRAAVGLASLTGLTSSLAVLAAGTTHPHLRKGIGLGHFLPGAEN